MYMTNLLQDSLHYPNSSKEVFANKGSLQRFGGEVWTRPSLFLPGAGKDIIQPIGRIHKIHGTDSKATLPRGINGSQSIYSG